VKQDSYRARHDGPCAREDWATREKPGHVHPIEGRLSLFRRPVTSRVHCCDPHLHCADQEEPRWVLTQLGSSLTTLRADPPSEQQVHSTVSLRRAVDAV
jgi:hypothetical protein